MKKTTLSGLLAIALATGMVACNNSSDTATTTTTQDSMNTTTPVATPDNTTTTTTTTVNNYSALADSFRVNSEAGNYLNPRTGKALKIRVDTATGARFDEATGEPVWRYVDKRDYKVYSGDYNTSAWDTVGTARMQNNRIEYMGDNNSWVNYDKRWKTEDDERAKTWKTKVGDTKIKMDRDGDVKIKDQSTGDKVKYDADDNKVKVKTDSTN